MKLMRSRNWKEKSGGNKKYRKENNCGKA